jgi:hypothetical protein
MYEFMLDDDLKFMMQLGVVNHVSSKYEIYSKDGKE